MCVGKVGETLAKTTPHRLFGLPSYLDPMLHPDSKYNAPKIVPYKDGKVGSAQAGATPAQVNSILMLRKQKNAAGINPTLVSGTPDTPVLPVGGG